MLKIRHMLLCLLLLVVSAANAQTKTISGLVTSENDGEPIPGVSILLVGQGSGTVTDIEGNYTISVPNNDATLRFTFIGMETKDVVVGNATTLNIELADGALQMDEVVVTAMGISREKKSIGYASQSVSGEDIAASATINPMNALQGKVAGLDIATAPGPGATQNVIIRGASSLSSNQPLYDFGSGINALNSDDIENMTVLKGAAATALYGSRAANGVILITTKTGKNTNGKMKIAYNGSVSINRVGRIAKRQSTFGQGWSGNYALDENGNWGPKYDDQDRTWGYAVDGSQMVKPYSFVEDRIRDFYDLGLSYKNSISGSGGNEKTNYFISLSQNSVDGVIPEDNDTYDRYTIAVKGKHTYNKLTISSNFNYSNEKTKAVPSGQGSSVFQSLWEVPESYSLVDMKNYKDTYYDLDTYFTPYGVNPYYALNENSAKQSKNKFFGKFQLDYQILDNLNATYRFGGDFESSVAEMMIAKTSIPESAPSYNENKLNAGSYEMNSRKRYEYNHDFLVNYDKELSSTFNLNALVGLNVNERGYNRIYGETSALDLAGFYDFSNGTTTSEAKQYEEQRRLVGLFANAELSYDKFLFLNLSARNDWSSTLPEENNSFFYSGATVSFLITELLEKQGAKPDAIDFAKVRVAYGQTGNDASPYKVDPYFQKGYVNNPGYPNVDDLELPINGVNAWTVSNTLGSPDLKPEITTEFEVGLEANFFNNRLGFDVSYYDRYTEGLIQYRPLDPSSGYTSITSNLGDISNKGIEVLLTGSPIRTKDFDWNMGVTFAKNNNLVEKLPEGEVSIDGYGGMTIVAVEGKELGLFKTTVAEKVMIDGEEHTVVDGNGMVVGSSEVKVTDKSIQEKFSLGFTNSFSYKAFTLSGTLDLHYGGYIYSRQKNYMAWTGSGYETTFNDRNTFIVPNSVIDNGDGTYSENTTPVSSGSFHTFYSDYGAFDAEENNIIDRSYLKLRDVRLSYKLPKTLTSRLKMQSITASVVAGNILIWTPSENVYIDPETTSFGNDIGAKFGEFGANPTNQVYTFNLSLTF